MVLAILISQLDNNTLMYDRNLRFDKIYDEKVPFVKSTANPIAAQRSQPKEGIDVDYADVYVDNDGLGSALQSSKTIDNRYNPSRRSSSTALVVYDPTQKYQQSLEVPNYQIVQSEIQDVKKPIVRKQLISGFQERGGFAGLQKQYAPKSQDVDAQTENYGELYEHAATPNRQVAQQAFTKNGIALNSALNLARKNNVAPLQTQDVDMPEWAKNIKLPVQPTNNQLKINQTKSMMDARGKMLQGYQHQADMQAKMNQYHAQQQGLQAQKVGAISGKMFFGK
jgi:hypothetical protein